MSGMVVGIDGSHNSSHALDWAMSEAAVRNAELTVITVNSVPAGYWTRQPVTMSGDAERVEEIRKSALEAIDKAAVALGDKQPKSVSVVAIRGIKQLRPDRGRQPGGRRVRLADPRLDRQPGGSPQPLPGCGGPRRPEPFGPIA
jgi:Universal stress protein family